MTKMAAWWRSGPGRGRFPPPCGERSTIGTGAAGFRAAASASARGIISTIGRTGARLRCRTSPFYVADIIAPSTRRAIRSRADPTARSDSRGPMAGRCLRCRCLLRCPGIPSGRSGRVTTRTACASPRERRAPPGSGKGWMWAGRSTCCTRERRNGRWTERHRGKGSVVSERSGRSLAAALTERTRSGRVRFAGPEPRPPTWRQ